MINKLHLSRDTASGWYYVKVLSSTHSVIGAGCPIPERERYTGKYIPQTLKYYIGVKVRERE